MIPELTAFSDKHRCVFTPDESRSSYEARIDWCGVDITLNILLGANIQEGLRTAEVLLASQSEWKRRFETIAVRDLLELKNESWLEDGERQLSPEEFKCRMLIEAISVYPEGVFEIAYNDGDLFWGHSILVSGNIKQGPLRAEIAG